MVKMQKGRSNVVVRARRIPSLLRVSVEDGVDSEDILIVLESHECVRVIVMMEIHFLCIEVPKSSCQVCRSPWLLVTWLDLCLGDNPC